MKIYGGITPPILTSICNFCLKVKLLQNLNPLARDSSFYIASSLCFQFLLWKCDTFSRCLWVTVLPRTDRSPSLGWSNNFCSPEMETSLRTRHIRYYTAMPGFVPHMIMQNCRTRRLVCTQSTPGPSSCCPPHTQACCNRRWQPEIILGFSWKNYIHGDSFMLYILGKWMYCNV
jgi:hypothetical protein